MISRSRTFPLHNACSVFLMFAAVIGCGRWANAEETAEAAVRLKGTVVSAEGRPVAGALVAFTGIWRQSEAPETIETDADAKGRFELTLLGVERLPGAYFGTVWAYDKGRGIARQELMVPAESELQLKLPPGSPTRIKVLGPDGAPAVGAQVMHSGLRIAVTRNGKTVYGSASLPELLAARTTVVTDSDGFAVLTAMTPDEISGIRCITPKWGSQEVYRPHAAPGEPVMRLRRVGRVLGRVVCEDTNAVRGIKVRLMTTGDAAEWDTVVRGEALATTDDAGRFEATLAAGRLTASASPSPDLPYLPGPSINANLPAEGELEISIGLERAVQVRGVVRAKGGGRLHRDAQLMRNRGQSAFVPLELDRDGRFEFVQPLGKTVQILSSPHEDRHAWVAYDISPNDLAEAAFELPPLELLTAKGRIVDDAGRPVPAARVEQAWMRYQYDGKLDERKLRYGTEPHLLSAGADGRFEVQVAANHAYRLRVAADGMGPTLTDWIDFSRPEVNAFPDIVLQHSRTLSGRVVDRQGRPLVGATVFQAANHVKRTEAVTNGRGEYKLDGLSAGDGFVFARHEGYRFHGQVLDADTTQLKIVMTRVDEAPAKMLKPLRRELTPGEERDLARQLMRAPLEQTLASGDDGAKRRTLEVWAQVDPHDCLKRLESATFADRGEVDAVRIALANALVAEAPDMASAALKHVESAWHRVLGGVELAQAAPVAARDLRLQILTSSLPVAERIEEPPMRVIALALLARKLAEAGEREQAEQIARQQADRVNEIEYDSDDCYGAMAHIVVATALAPYDLETALQLTPQQQGCAETEDEEARDEERAELRRFQLASIAKAIAASAPAESERVIRLIEDRDVRANEIAGLCSRLAAVDLPRARRMAATIESKRERACAEGELAKAAATTDRRVAAECLAEAFRLLVQAANDSETARIDDARLAAGWLPIAEQLAPERLEEFLWRAISLTHSDAQLSLDSVYQVQIVVAVAAFTARYDRRAGQLLLGESENALRTLGGDQGSHQFGAYAAYFAALASIDPHAAVALLDEASDKGDELYDGKSHREAARHAVVQFLASQGESRSRTLNKLVGIPDYSADDF